ncbi:MAG: hypothetical protein NZ741_06380 [Armatimonadetes bacterium]|nr:hypothetical protein [Armatimonadota bacterium]
MARITLGREHESNRRWLYYKNRYGMNGRVQNWEAHDRHNGGSVYVFVDAHARWFHADAHPLVCRVSEHGWRANLLVSRPPPLPSPHAGRETLSPCLRSDDRGLTARQEPRPPEN